MNLMRFAAASLALIAGACDTPFGNKEGSLALRFTTSPAARVSTAGFTPPSADELSVVGANGTLHIEDIRFIVSEFELEGTGGSCANHDDEDGCEEFESGPFVVDLPLASGVVTLAESDVPAGLYRELEFEVESLGDDDGDDAAERLRSQAVLAELRAAYPNFPRGASMVVKGTFTRTGGTPQPFIVYFDAEIEIELDLVPPLTVPGATAVTVNVHPELWFKRGTQVVDLAALNGRLVDFEFEMESGFGEVDIDD